jgi:hypothetical protein
MRDILQPWIWVLMWLQDFTTFKCESHCIPNLFNYHDTHTLIIYIYFHPNQYKFYITYFLSIFNTYNFVIFMILNYFLCTSLSNMGSHSTWLCTDWTSCLWMLPCRRSNKTKTYCHNRILLFTHWCVLTVNVKHFVLLLNSNTTWSIKITNIFDDDDV